MTARQVSRRGKSLIEMVVVIAGMSAVVTTAGQMLHRLGKAERSIRDSVAVGRAEMRLARAFRGDVRAAASAEPLPDGRGLRLTTPEGAIDYVAGDGAVLRTADADGASRREGYWLGRVAVTFAVESDRFAVLSVEPRRDSRSPEAAAGALRVLAAIGADRPGGADAADGPEPVEAPRPTPEGGA